jgi:hypothetical protein
MLMTGIQESERSPVSSAFGSTAEIRKATTKCHAPRHICISKIKPPIHPPTLHRQCRTIFNRKRHFTPPSLPLLWYKSKHDSVRSAIVPDNETSIMSGENRRETKLKTKQSREFVVTCSEATSTPTYGGDYPCIRHIFSKHSLRRT